jgi:uracil-DNA glycosylase family 4
VTHPHSDLAVRALAEFWADMGLEEGRVLSARLMARRGSNATRSQERTSQPATQQARTAPAMPTGPRPEPRRLGGNPIADARRLAAAATTLAELRAAVEGFNGCDLKKASKNTVVCDGAFDAPVMIVGEAPGGEEDARGLPFVGRAGKLLDKMLATIGLSRQDNVYITNLIYWRPPGNRDPSPVEMQLCAPFLMRQIELKQPKLLLTVGKFATHAMLGREDGIMKLRGRKLSYAQDGIAAIPTIPTLHPAYLLRNPADKAKAWDDLRTIAKLCDDLGIKRAPGL